MWNEAVVAESLYYPGIWLEDLKKTTENLSRYSPCPGRDSNHEHPGFKTETLQFQPTFSEDHRSIEEFYLLGYNAV
jgi:hypothetical protein